MGVSDAQFLQIQKKYRSSRKWLTFNATGLEFEMMSVDYLKKMKSNTLYKRFEPKH